MVLYLMLRDGCEECDFYLFDTLLRFLSHLSDFLAKLESGNSKIKF